MNSEGKAAFVKWNEQKTFGSGTFFETKNGPNSKGHLSISLHRCCVTHWLPPPVCILLTIPTSAVLWSPNNTGYSPILWDFHHGYRCHSHCFPCYPQYPGIGPIRPWIFSHRNIFEITTSSLTSTFSGISIYPYHPRSSQCKIQDTH